MQDTLCFPFLSFPFPLPPPFMVLYPSVGMQDTLCYALPNARLAVPCMIAPHTLRRWVLFGILLGVLAY